MNHWVEEGAEKKGRKKMCRWIIRGWKDYLAILVPLTTRIEEWLVAPALLEAEQVYSPACLAATDSMLRILFFRVVARILMSERSGPIGSLFNAQEISIGTSPFTTAHTTEIESPQFAGFSAISKGAISGETGISVNKHTIFLNCSFVPFRFVCARYHEMCLARRKRKERGKEDTEENPIERVKEK